MISEERLKSVRMERDEAIALASKMEGKHDRDTSPYWRRAEAATERCANLVDEYLSQLSPEERQLEEQRMVKDFLTNLAKEVSHKA